LKKDGLTEKIYIHRAVATAFVQNENPEVNNIVNHLDSNPRNNEYTNLEWTTHYGNMHHAIAKGRFQRTPVWLENLRKTNEKNGKSVIGVHLETGKILKYICLNDCSRDGFEQSCVCVCCKNERRTHAGYRWRYATLEEKEQMMLQTRPPDEVEAMMKFWEERTK
jgi:hypothetical protein